MIEPGTAAFWRTSLALFAAGMATFALLYCVQPLMPVFGAAFRIGPASSALALSVTTMPLALAMLLASAVADRFGRVPVMVAALLSSALLCGACALAPGFTALLGLRALMGITLSGLPAVAMAYVSEEMSPRAAGLGMGLYIGGSAIGGMTGRLLAASVAEWAGWRPALAAIAATGLLCGMLLWRFLPPSQHWARRAFQPGAILRGFTRPLGNAVVVLLAAEGFLLMGAFVTVYNYVGYRLLAPPYALSQSAIGLIFVVYLAGVVSSAAMGQLAIRIGRRRVLTGNILLMLAGLAVSVTSPLWAVILSVAMITAGFFGAHSVASAWVGHTARGFRAQASAFYLLAYYAGSSIVGYGMGFVWSAAAWTGLASALAVLIGAGLIAARLLPPDSSNLMVGGPHGAPGELAEQIEHPVLP